MNIFKGRKERESEKRKDREDLVEVPSYSPHDFRPLDYMAGEEWEQFEENFEQICRESLEKIQPDEFNATYMDPLIKTNLEVAIERIGKQSILHRLLIKENIRKLHQGDEICERDRLKHYEEDYQMLLASLEQDRKVYYKNTPWENFYGKENHNGNVERREVEKREEAEYVQ